MVILLIFNNCQSIKMPVGTNQGCNCKNCTWITLFWWRTCYGSLSWSLNLITELRSWEDVMSGTCECDCSNNAALLLFILRVFLPSESFCIQSAHLYKPDTIHSCPIYLAYFVWSEKKNNNNALLSMDGLARWNICVRNVKYAAQKHPMSWVFWGKKLCSTDS